MNILSDKYTEIEFFYNYKNHDGRLELKSSVYRYTKVVSIDDFIVSRIEVLKSLRCYVFQVAIRDVVKTTTKVLEYEKRGEQIEIL